MNQRAAKAEVERCLAAVAARLRVSKAYRQALLLELGDHLEAAVEEARCRGVSEEGALRRAVAELGDAGQLAERFSEVVRNSRRRRIMRWSVGSLTAAAAAAMVALSLLPATQPPVLSTVVAADPNLKALTAEDSANAATHAKLAKPITIEMVETPLSESVEYLASTTGAQIYVKWRRLADEGVEKDAPVTIKLKEVPADLALSLLLEQVAGDVRYTVERGIVIISSSGDLDGKTNVCVYNVRDLLATATTGMPRKAAPAGKPSEKTGDGKPAAKEPIEPVDELIETLTSTIVPASWDTVGGPGSIAVFNGLLVINQTSTIQTEIEKLLRMLREAEQQPAAK